MAPKFPSVSGFAKATLRPKRKASGMTMGDLAAAMGVSVVQVSDWERGLKPMSVGHFANWCQALHIPDDVARLLRAAHAMTFVTTPPPEGETR